VASNTAPVTYTIQAGDTLLALAYQFGVPELALQDANGITDPQDLQIGQELSVPSVPAGEEEFAAPAVAQLAGWHLPARLNGLPLDSIVVLPAAVRQHIRQIYARGQALGRNPRAFSKVGDSTMVYPPFLAAFADPDAYQLGPYACLRPVIDQFPGSFGRASAAAKRGMHTWTEFDPAWVASDACQPGEGPLDCELRLNNPSIALIRLGANDVSDPDLYDAELRKIVDFWISNGVIPVVGSKPDRQEGSANTINHIVHIVAADKRIPLWDYDLVASTVPGKGLGPDQIHFLASYDRDYGLPAAFGAADSLEDLTGLIMLGSIEEALGNAD
jgi:LysM repeat protein